MREIKSPFGTMLDEQAMTDQFFELHGRDTAEALDRIMQNSYPMPRMSCLNPPKTRDQVFTEKALREGFSRQVVNDFLQLANL